MLSIRDVMQLQEGERVTAVVRRHASAVVPGFLLSGVLIALPFFFLFPLVHTGFIGAVIISLSLAAGLFFALKTLLMWDANALIATDRRVVIVRQKGPWDRHVTEWPLYGLTVTVEQHGMFDSLFRTGNLSLLGAGASTPAVMEHIAQPERLASLLQKLRPGQNASGFKLKEL
ncbi:MAG TPA: hypothetical protein VMU11_00385 [Verrucomicrobiae bacterium]|nr:hypothetical protein [Verrucomicrobiae bacterium]